MKNKNFEIDMTKGPIVTNMLRYVIPLICTNLIQFLFNAADMAIVGKFGSEYAMAAVGATSYISSFMLNSFNGLAVGVNVVAAKYFALKDHENLSQTVHTTVAMAMIGGIILIFAGYILAYPVLILTDTPVENGVLEMAVTYIRTYFWGAPVILTYFFTSAVLRAIGDTRRPLLFIVIAGILNLIFNVIFVCALHMGVVGVALGTILSQAFAAGMVISVLVRDKGALHLTISGIRLHFSKVTEIIKQGIPACLQQMMFAYVNMSMQAAVNTFGAIVVAGNVAVASLEGILYSAPIAFQQAMTTIIGQNAAVNNLKRIKKILIDCLAIVFIFETVICVLATMYGHQILRLFTSSQDVIEVGCLRMLCIIPFYGIAGTSEAVAGVLRGMGHTIAPTVSCFFCVFVFRLFWIYMIFGYFQSLPSLYILMPCSFFAFLAVNLICFIFIYRRNVRKSGVISV